MLYNIRISSVHTYTIIFVISNHALVYCLLPMRCLTEDPEDYSSAMRYKVTFRQTVLSDGDVPANTALSSPILINITNDNLFESVEYFQAHILETSDRFRVRVGQQNTVNVMITNSESCMFSIHINPYHFTTIVC